MNRGGSEAVERKSNAPPFVDHHLRHISGGKFGIISAYIAGVVQWLTTPDL